MAIVTMISVSLTDKLGLFFGVCFVLVSVSAALAADVRSLYTPGVLPPLLLITLLVLVSVVSPHVIDAPGLSDTASSAQRIIAGVVDHATPLILGHLLALGAIAYRIAKADG